MNKLQYSDNAPLIIIWRLWLVRKEEGYLRRWSGLQMRFTLIFLVARRCSTFPRFAFSGQHHLWYHHNALVGRHYHSWKIGFDHSLRMQQHWNYLLFPHAVSCPNNREEKISYYVKIYIHPKVECVVSDRTLKYYTTWILPT